MNEGLGEPPEGLTGVALAKWNELGPIVDELGTATNADRGAFETLCLAYAASARATKTIEDLGDVLQSERGWTRNPACMNQSAAFGTIAKLSAHFGLTPASRSKMKIAKKIAANPFEKI